MRTILFLFVVGFCASISNAQTVVVEDTHLSFASSSDGLGDYSATACQDLLCDPTSVWFDYSAGSIESVNWNVDEESDWYVVEFGEEFSTATIAANEHPVIFTTDNARGPVSVGGTDFYLGVSTGIGLKPNSDPAIYDPNRDVFGWVHLRDNGGNLEFISSAMAYGGEGIIVGTTTAIPEPATGTGILLLFVAASLSRSRRS